MKRKSMQSNIRGMFKKRSLLNKSKLVMLSLFLLSSTLASAQYTVNYEEGAGSALHVSNMPANSASISSGITYTLGQDASGNNIIPIRLGFTFVGWKTDVALSSPSGTPSAYSAGDIIHTETAIGTAMTIIMPSSNVDLIAQWELDPPTVSGVTICPGGTASITADADCPNKSFLWYVSDDAVDYIDFFDSRISNNGATFTESPSGTVDFWVLVVSDDSQAKSSTPSYDNGWYYSKRVKVTIVVEDASVDVEVANHCNGSNPTGVINVLDVQAGSTYKLVGVNPVVPEQTGISYTQLAPGDYEITRTTSIGCVATTTATILNTYPVGLLSFTAECADDYSIVNWSTASELNNDYFTLESSFDLKNWSVVSKTQGAGNSNIINNYQVELESYAKTAYYRLSQTDFDGTTVSLSNITLLPCDAELILNVYPNPAQGEVNITIDGFTSHQAVMEIYNFMGSLIITESNIDNGLNKVNIDNLSSGTYLIKITDGRSTKTTRFVVK